MADLRAYDTISEARYRLVRFIEFYNTCYLHASLGAKTPDEFYLASLPAIQQAA